MWFQTNFIDVNKVKFMLLMFLSYADKLQNKSDYLMSKIWWAIKNSSQNNENTMTISSNGMDKNTNNFPLLEYLTWI